jgi:hypothetical protein
MDVAVLTPEQAMICMQHTKKIFKERLGEEAKRMVEKVEKDEQKLGKCRRSILMHNADKWMAGNSNMQGYKRHASCEDDIHWAIGAWQVGGTPISVYLTFGSAQQKTTFSRIIGNRIRHGDERA